MQPVEDNELVQTAPEAPLATLPESLIPANYADLRALAAAILADSQPSLAATGVVHEAFLRMAAAAGAGETGGDGARFDTRAEFMAYAATTIRSILVDHARRRCAAKRGGGGRPRPLDEQGEQGEPSSPQELTAAGLLDLNQALDRLGALCERQRRVVELRFFCQLSVEQTAAALGVSPRTVKSDWRCARAWLRQELGR